MFPWTQTQLIRAAQTVHSAATTQTTAAVATSSSYAWRHARWSYLCSYPPTAWNTLYQRLFESVPSSPFDAARKQEAQRALMEQFQLFSRNVVELIMEEIHLPAAAAADAAADPPHLHSKFLPPLAVGGIAGGEKFLCNSILFKFARDWAGLFSEETMPGGGDAAVQKSAANEIRAMNAIIQHDGALMLQAPLSLTLTCLVRVRGSVVICTALAPIQGRASLVYGSANAGKDIRDAADEPRVQRVVQQLADDWKLASHPVADASHRIHMLPLACDVEMHMSLSDGRLYLLDLARFLPPTPPSAGSMEHLYLSLRPEWMRRNLVATQPLSADVFSGFGAIDNASYSAAVHANMRAMKFAAMPRVALGLQQWWDRLIARPDTNLAYLSSPCAFASEETTLSSCISQILHAEGINVRFLSLVRCYVPSDPSVVSESSLPSLSRLLLYDLVARTAKQLYFGWIRRMMLAVGHMHEEEVCSSPDASSATTAASTASPRSGRSGWTDTDLERWLRSINKEPEPERDANVPVIASSFHHESALLFALLLRLFFGSDGEGASSCDGLTSSSFFADLLWPSLETKFGKWSFAEPERMEYERECRERGEQVSDLPRPDSEATPLVSERDRRAFEASCRAFCSSGGDDASGLPIFLRMLLESLGLDWFALRHALARLSVDDVFTPRDFVRAVVPRVSALNGTVAATSLDPTTIALLFMPSFEPQLKRVRCLSFLSLAEAESQLLASLAARSAALERAGQDARNPALLSTLWALVSLYEVHREQDQTKATPTAATAAVSADGSAPVLSCFERGRAVLLQIESIYTLLLSGVASLSDSARRDVESQICFAKIGWFYLRFGQLARAREYFAREHALRVEAVAREEAAIAAASTATAVAGSVPPSLLLLAQSLESMGIIARELGDLAASLAYFQACFGAYQRIYGINLEADQITTNGKNPETEGEDSPAAEFRRSLALATLYTNLANSYGSTGDLARKRRFLESALEIVQTHHSTPALTASGTPTPHPSQIQIVCALSICFSGPDASVEDLQKAQSMLQQCIEWNRALHGTCKRTQVGPADASSVVAPSSDPSELEFEDEHPSSAALFTTLANVVGRLPGPASLPSKIRLLERALRLVSRHSGLVHQECAVILTNLGMAQGQMGGAAGIARGLATLQQALALKTKLYGSAVHNEVALTLSNMSVLFGAAGDLQQEMRSLTQALQIFMTVIQKQAMAAREAAAPSVAATSSPSAQPAAPSDLPASASALASNPALVCTQQRLFRCRQRLLATQAALVSAGRCTFVASGSNRTVQKWWKCFTCSPNPKSGLGCCEACVTRCHKDHVTEAQEPSSFYCDCGEGVFPAPCCALKPREAAELGATKQG